MSICTLNLVGFKLVLDTFNSRSLFFMLFSFPIILALGHYYAIWAESTDFIRIATFVNGSQNYDLCLNISFNDSDPCDNSCLFMKTMLTNFNNNVILTHIIFYQ